MARTRRRTYYRRRHYRKRRTYARKTFRRNGYRRATTSTKKKYWKLRKTPIFHLPQLNNYRNYKYVNVSKTTEFSYTQAAISAAKGQMVEDFLISHIMEQRTYQDLCTMYRDMVFLSAVVTIYISNFEQAVGIINAAPQTVAQVTDTRMKPHILCIFCHDPETQSGMSLYKNDSSGVQEAWTNMPTVQRLSQMQKGIWKWNLPRSLRNVYNNTNSFSYATKIGDLSANISGGETFFNHLHGFVALFRDVDDYDNHLKFKLTVKIDSCLLFKIKRPSA